MDRKLERLIEVLDDMDARIQDLEQRQLQIVRALNELLTRLEQTEE
jgi:prefoldin subunit 5